MRRPLQTLLFLATSVLLVWILKQVFPKNSGILNLFLLLLFLDALLWSATRDQLRRLKPVRKITLSILFWLPFGLIIAGVVYGFFTTFYYWPRFLRMFLTSLVFISYTARIIPVLFLLVTLLWQGMQWLMIRGTPGVKPWSRQPGYLFRAGWWIGALVFFVMLAGMIGWEHHVKVRTVEIGSDRLPPAFDNFRIVQISDIHLGSWNRKNKLEELVERIHSLQPDLVFFTGDLCNYSTADALPFRLILDKIRARYGIFAVFGNHDYGDYMTWPSPTARQKNLLDLVQLYQDMGWHLLRNEHRVLALEGDSLVIIGVENWGAEKRFQRLADLPKALKGVEPAPFKLLLSHDPTYWDSIVSNRYPEIDITFSGHTHGGQIGVETEKWKWSPVRYLYPHWAGIYGKTWPDGRQQYLYVNRGAGTIVYSGRIGIWAEITLVLLKRTTS